MCSVYSVSVYVFACMYAVLRLCVKSTIERVGNMRKRKRATAVVACERVSVSAVWLRLIPKPINIKGVYDVFRTFATVR